MRSDRAGIWLLVAGAALLLYGTTVQYLPDGVHGLVRTGGTAGYIPIVAGLALIALGAVLRFGE